MDMMAVGLGGTSTAIEAMVVWRIQLKVGRRGSLYTVKSSILELFRQDIEPPEKWIFPEYAVG